MTLPVRVRIPAAISKACFQPTISKGALHKHDDRETWDKFGEKDSWLERGRSYGGGGLQYVIRVQMTDEAINSSIAALISLQPAKEVVATNPGLFLSER